MTAIYNLLFIHAYLEVKRSCCSVFRFFSLWNWIRPFPTVLREQSWTLLTALRCKLLKRDFYDLVSTFAYVFIFQSSLLRPESLSEGIYGRFCSLPVCSRNCWLFYILPLSAWCVKMKFNPCIGQNHKSNCDGSKTCLQILWHFSHQEGGLLIPLPVLWSG